MNAAELARLAIETPAPAYQNLFRAVFSAASEIDQLEPGRFGAGRGQRVGARDPQPVRDAVLGLAQLLNLRIT